MHRVLFEIFGHPVSGYWFFYGLGMLAAVTLALCLGRRRAVAMWKVLLVCVGAVLGAFVFGRLNALLYRGSPAEFFDIQQPGQVSFGGAMGALFLAVLLIELLRIPRPHTLDVLACVIPLAQGIQRIGCFCHGCCYGPASSSLLSVQFPKHVNAAGQTVGSPCFLGHLRAGLVDASALYSQPVFPIQLVAVTMCLAIAAVCLLALLRNRLQGRILWLYFILYGAMRFVVQWFRPDYDANAAPAGWNTGHTMSLAILAIGIVMLIRSRRDAETLTIPQEINFRTQGS